jgi:tRNA pseudouridine38-40 synthase
LRTIKLTIGYDGTDFKGWQVQPNTPTIQAEVTRAIEKVTGERVTVEPSGRTDSGVHAIGQTASFQTATAIPSDNLAKALNTQLPRSIRIYSAEDRDPGFHARFNACAKTYRYRLYRGPVCPPDRWRYVHHFPYPLNVAEMHAAAAAFEGTHDFTSFTSPEELPSGSPERTIHLSRFNESDSELVYTVRGSGFLHHMVRNMVGTLVEVGKGNWSAADIPRIIAARDRAVAGPSLSAKGLWLVEVEYA